MIWFLCSICFKWAELEETEGLRAGWSEWPAGGYTCPECSTATYRPTTEEEQFYRDIPWDGIGG